VDEQVKKALFFEIHTDNPREGPGSFESTAKAYSMLQDLPHRPKILDIGCGPGRQTLDLATISTGTILAVDKHLPYVENLARQVNSLGLSRRISVVSGDMKALDLEARSFDLIWAEGSIYIIGFEKGFRDWSSLLKRKGCIAVSELTWLKSKTPKELKGYWEEHYPAMMSIEENVQTIAACGYRPLNHFQMPHSDWWDNYYIPLEKKISFMKLKYRHSEKATEMLAEEQVEIDMFRRYSEYYGYVFYLAQLLE